MKVYLKENGVWKLFNIKKNSKELKKRKIKIGYSAKIGDYAEIGDSAKIGYYEIVPNIKYKYIESPVPMKDGNHKIKLGCFTRFIQEWETNFNNNKDEFPIGSKKLELRKWAYNVCKLWLEGYDLKNRK